MSRSDTALRYFEEHRGYTEERIAYGISQHRKGRGTVTVTDRDGRATLDGFYGVYDVVAEGEGIHYRGEASYSSTGRQIRLTL